MKKKNIAVLGSTGSIGRQALAVVDAFPECFQVVSLAAGNNVEFLAAQARKYQPKVVCIGNEERAQELAEQLQGISCEIVVGREGAAYAAAFDEVDLVLAAISGIAGLLPVIEAIKAGKDIAFANKEVLVAAGQLVMDLVRQHGVKMFPVDSEHSAVWQCLTGEKREVESLLLTASGGPFRNFTPTQLAQVRAADALKHPTWSMGAKITIDSATLMNKGFEIIEARWLFDMPYEKIKAVVHPQSVIHSMVQYVDGAILAQLGPTDMRLAIQYAFTYPERWENGLERLDFSTLSELTFAAPDTKRFPCLALAIQAGKAGDTYPVVLNGANEVLVDLFLHDKISFLDIPRFIEMTLAAHNSIATPSLSDILACDQWARAFVYEKL